MAKVLLATADSGLFDIFSAEIEADGYEVAWAVNGQDAYEMTLAQAPELVLADASLSVHTGLELCQLLRADPDVPRDLPFVLMLDSDMGLHQLEKAGVTRTLPKSHDEHTLRDLLTDYLAGYRAR